MLLSGLGTPGRGLRSVKPKKLISGLKMKRM